MSDRIYKIGEYEYSASLVVEGFCTDTWMVRRFKIGEASYDEAEIRTGFTEPIDVIKLAIERGSWA